jgi:hypothetical protein
MPLLGEALGMLFRHLTRDGLKRGAGAEEGNQKGLRPWCHII